MKVTRIAITIMFLGCMLLSGCEDNQAQLMTKDYETQLQLAKKQLNIVKKMIPQEPNVLLASATQILTEYYPMLFKQKDSEALFDFYAKMTWHTSEKSRELLKKDIDKHTDYQKIDKLYQDQILPQKKDHPYPEYRIIEMKINYLPIKGEERSYLISAIYEIYKKDSTITLPVELKLPENSEFFSELFYSNNSDPHDYGLPSNELNEVRREMMRLLIG